MRGSFSFPLLTSLKFSVELGLYKSCVVRVFQIQLLHAYTALVGIRARLGSCHGTKKTTWGRHAVLDDMYERDEVARHMHATRGVLLVDGGVV
jgi:hypothetical protein